MGEGGDDDDGGGENFIHRKWTLHTVNMFFIERVRGREHTECRVYKRTTFHLIRKREFYLKV